MIPPLPDENLPWRAVLWPSPEDEGLRSPSFVLGSQSLNCLYSDLAIDTVASRLYSVPA
jgi:hypothetical protein